MQFKEQGKVVHELEASIDSLNQKLAAKEAELEKLKSSNQSLKHKVSEANRDQLQDIEIEKDRLSEAFEKQKDALARRHAQELEYQREELRRVNEEKLDLVGQLQIMQVSLESA